MGNLFGTIKSTGLTSADGAAYEMRNRHLPQQSAHQLSVYPADGATGTVPVKIRPKGAPADYAEELMAQDGTTAVVIDLEEPTTISFPIDAPFAAIEAVILDCSAVTGEFDAVLESR